MEDVSRDTEPIVQLLIVNSSIHSLEVDRRKAGLSKLDDYAAQMWIKPTDYDRLLRRIY